MPIDFSANIDPKLRARFEQSDIYKNILDNEGKHGAPPG
jgi:hypothetical protein